MELNEVFLFALGCVSGGFIFGTGVIVGVILVKFQDYLQRSSGPVVKSDDVEIFDEEHFEKAQLSPEEGGHKFDTSQEMDDDFLKELEELNRHSA